MGARALSQARRRTAPVEPILFPSVAVDAIIGDDGTITTERASLEIRRWDAGGGADSSSTSIPSRVGRRR